MNGLHLPISSMSRGVARIWRLKKHGVLSVREARGKNIELFMS